MKRTTTHITAQADSRRRSLPGSADGEVRSRVTARTTVAIAAAALLLPALTACTIVSRDVPGGDEPIAFASFVPDVTKAVVESAGDMSEFAVWGLYTPAGAAAATEPPVFDGERVYRSGNFPDAPWIYDIPRFWTEGTYDFYALYPYETALNQSVSATTDNFGIRSYDASVLDEDDGAPRDLMLAVSADKEYDGPADSGEVSFTFHHLLCMIEFEVINPSSTEDEPSVSSASLYGMHRKWDFMADGTFGIGNTAESIAAGWKNMDEQTSADNPYCMVENLSISSNTSQSLFGNIMMVPQTVTDALVFNIIYQDYTGEHELTIPLSTTGVTAWNAGKKYRYTLTLNTPGDVGLNITVNDWETIKDEEGGYDTNDYLIHW